MKSWSQRELALAVLVVLAAIFVPYAAVPLLARLEQLLSSSATPLILFLYAWISALVTGMPFFLWARKGRRVWPWILILTICLGLLFLLSRNLDTAAHLVAVFTDFYDTESTAFLLLFAMLTWRLLSPGSSAKSTTDKQPARSCWLRAAFSAKRPQVDPSIPAACCPDSLRRHQFCPLREGSGTGDACGVQQLQPHPAETPAAGDVEHVFPLPQRHRPVAPDGAVCLLRCPRQFPRTPHRPDTPSPAGPGRHRCNSPWSCNPPPR